MRDAQSVILSRTAIVLKKCLIRVFDIRKAAFQTDRRQTDIPGMSVRNYHEKSGTGTGRTGSPLRQCPTEAAFPYNADL